MYTSYTVLGPWAYVYSYTYALVCGMHGVYCSIYKGGRMIKIVGRRNSENIWQVLDVFPSLAEALKELNNYRLAYGKNWTLDIRVK